VSSYTVREVEHLLGIPRSVIHNLINAGFVAPARGKRREYRFSFQDLIVLRTAQGLSSAAIAPRKIARSLRRLRAELPSDLPLSGLRITAVGDEVVVRDGASHWRADSGQYLLDFSVAPAQGSISALGKRAETTKWLAQDWFSQGCALDDGSPGDAIQAYENAIAADERYADAYINLGCLLHTLGRLKEAEQAYRNGLLYCPREASLHFNLGVLLEDLRRGDAAVNSYESALRIDPAFADAHYNLARLLEQRSKTKDALRHYAEYRRLHS
jgi:tetratricopeptide (TPR) repeat protein